MNDEYITLPVKYIEKLQQENQDLKRNCNIGYENLIFYWTENKQLHNKIDKAIEYLINPPEKIWEGHSIDEVVRILKDSDVDE